ncbi:hypothetical protein ACL02S_08865 [Nocardia sp. 004]|uniref:hypothetical protein n=1 Tax=Nocardia sp. 004 TaxID=3385978 RepID=UPI0039A1FCE5
MGVYSTVSRQESPQAEEDAVAVTARPVVPNQRKLAISALVSRIVGWPVFLGGLTGAVLGIAGLHVEITVAGLILACTAGLVLLKFRADSGESD